MEKALSMFSEDFGSFRRPHSEPLAFPGKCWGFEGRGQGQVGTSTQGTN
jgi:hypothetical protein